MTRVKATSKMIEGKKYRWWGYRETKGAARDKAESLRKYRTIVI